jgi:hypothetical protein
MRQCIFRQLWDDSALFDHDIVFSSRTFGDIVVGYVGYGAEMSDELLLSFFHLGLQLC